MRIVKELCNLHVGTATRPSSDASYTLHGVCCHDQNHQHMALRFADCYRREGQAIGREMQCAHANLLRDVLPRQRAVQLLDVGPQRLAHVNDPTQQDATQWKKQSGKHSI